MTNGVHCEQKRRGRPQSAVQQVLLYWGDVDAAGETLLTELFRSRSLLRSCNIVRLSERQNG